MVGTVKLTFAIVFIYVWVDFNLFFVYLCKKE